MIVSLYYTVQSMKRFDSVCFRIVSFSSSDSLLYSCKEKVVCMC